MKASSKHYCSCNPRSKPNREEAKWYCYRHRRHLCDNCIYDELNQRHISCLVGTYEAFIKSPPSAYASYKHNKCPICEKLLPDDDQRAVVRLNCACVYHTQCLQEYLLSNTSNNIPCIKCNTPIACKPANKQKRSNLADSVDRFLRSVSRQRLWNKPKNLSSSTSPSKVIKDQTVIASNLDTAPQQNHIENVPNIIDTSQTKAIHKKTTHKISSNIPSQVGHIAVDMTRHRTVKTSYNKDRNMEDDKYNKPMRGRRNVKGRLKGKASAGSNKSWFTTRKTLVIVLLCCALIAQCCFFYMIFMNKSGNDGDGNVEGVKVGKAGQSEMLDILNNPDQKIRAQQGNIEGMVHNLPNKLKDEILGNKLKFQNLQKKMID